MKTSKKLLSFFLAVVMVVTTCSVGFTAFAQDNKNSIWTASSEAEDAFNTLNGLADEFLPGVLMGIDLVSKGVYEKYAKELGKDADSLTPTEKEDIAAKATLQDILAVLQPVLLNALGGTDQSEYPGVVGPSAFSDDGDYYSYLLKYIKRYTTDEDGNRVLEYLTYEKDENGDYVLDDDGNMIEKYVANAPISERIPDEDSMSFYSLYAICKEYRNDSSLSREARKTLSDWYDQLGEIANLEVKDETQEVIDRLGADLDPDDPTAYTWYNLEEIEDFYNDEYMANVSDEDKAVLAAAYEKYTAELQQYNCNIVIDSLPKLFFYGLGYGNEIKYFYAYSDLLSSIGVDLFIKGNYNLLQERKRNYDYDIPVAVTSENYMQVIPPYILAAYFSNPNSYPYVEMTNGTAYITEEAGAEKIEITNDNVIHYCTQYIYGSDECDDYDTRATIYWLEKEIAGTISNDVINDYYTDIITALAVRYSDDINSVDDFLDAVDAVLPKADENGNIFTADEINELASFFKLRNNIDTTAGSTTESNIYRFFKNGQDTYNDYVDITATVPANIRGTAVNEYFALMFENNRSNSVYKQNFLKAFFSEYDSYSYNLFLLQDGTAVPSYNNVTYDKIQRFEPSQLPKLNYNDGATYDMDKINEYVADAVVYAYAKVGADLLGVKSLGFDSAHGTNNTIFDYRSYLDSQVAPEPLKVVLTDDQLDILYGDYSLANEVGTELVNYILNDTIGVFFTDESPIAGILDINELIAGIVGSSINLEAAINDVWERLYASPVGTIFELLPILVVLLDSFIAPMLANAEGDKLYEFIGPLLPMVLPMLTSTAITTEDGSYIGLEKIGWDLNTLLPQVLGWLFDGEAAEGIEYWDGRTVIVKENVMVGSNDVDIHPLAYTLANCGDIDFEHYDVADANGNKLTVTYDNDGNASYSYLGKTSASLPALLADYPDTVFNCYMTYRSDVPYLTGIYIADKAIQGAKISDLGSLFTKLIKNDTAGSILGEVVIELATLFRVAVDEFVNSDRVNQKRYAADGKQTVVTGLNNIFVALPQLFDIMEDLAADKYGIAQDAWTYCYEGKIYTAEDGSTCNKVIEDIKAYADSDDPDRAVDILDWFADLFVGDWLNAIFSILNNVVSTDNEISNNLPIVMGLLNSLGGFGEDSILTDIFNGVFQIDRASEYSFTFEKQENGLTGLSKDNAYFLISNITTLVEVITNLVDKFGGDDAEVATLSDDSGISAQAEESKVYAKPAKASNADKNNYSDAELSNASSLINNLDKMISSLLADSTLNGFNLNKTDNILASVVTFFTNYMGNDCFTDIGKLLNSYTYYITGSETHTPDGKGNVDAKKVYTNESLTGLVVETFLLIENLVENLLADYYDVYTLDNGNKAQYNLLVEAIEGLISPDAIGVRLDGYDKVQKKLADYNCWHNAAAQTSRGDYKIKLDWGIKAGDKDAFYDGLSASLRLITSILSVVLVETNWYETVVSPLLGAFCTKNDIKLDTAEEFAALTNGYNDEVLLGLIRPFSEWFNKFLSAPVTTLIKSLQGLAGILDDKNGATIASILKGAITPLADEVNGLGSIFGIDSDYLGATSPSLQDLLGTVADMLLKFSNPSNLVPGLTINGANIIPIVNGLLDSTGFTLRQFNWNKFSNFKNPAAALVYVLDYVFDFVLDNNNLDALASLINNETVATILDLISQLKITSKDILAVLDRILEASDTPTLAYWTFSRYLQEIKFNGFYYPAGVTADMANRGVEQLDQLVAGLFPLLSSFGLNIGNSLEDVLDKNLFTNDLLTSAAVGIYGAIDGLDPTIKGVLKSIGLVSSTKDIAAILTDKSYGATYTAAANAIKAQSSWSDVKNINWGFTDGSDKAQQGFVNALAAILRPMYDVLSVFLSEGALHIDDVAYNAICSINVPVTYKFIDISTPTEKEPNKTPIRLRLEYGMKNGVFTLNFREDPNNRQLSRTSSLQLDFKSLKNLDDLKLMGSNGYNSFVIPLLEALQCSDIQTYAQYKNAAANAKDNLLLGILNPLVGDNSGSFLNKLVASPVSELTKLLPNIAMYLESNSLFQLVFNLLAPVTGIFGLTGQTVIDATDMLEELLGSSIMDVLLNAVSALLDSLDLGIVLPEIDLSNLIALGDAATYTSKATGADGRFLTGKRIENVDQGKVLVTVLRFVANVLVENAGALKGLLGKLDLGKNTDMILSIINSVFNTIANASPDQIVAAVFYLLAGNPQNAFWDYTKYKTGTYTFTYPESVDTEFLKQLPPMLDGLIGGLADLNSLIAGALFKDELITKLAKGLYGAIEGVKINDDLNLTQLLGQTDIDFSTENVAKLLVDEKYGQKFTSASATIAAAGSWKNVNENALKWGVTDRDSFFHALVAVLRPLYGVLDVLLNDAYLGLFDLVRLPGSNGYTSSIVPLMEAFSMYNIKTQYQYRQDINKEYDAILLDIINPLWDLVEDVLNAPLQTIAAIVPNLALFIGNNGLCQIFDNLLTPISALVDSIRPVVDLNDLLDTLFDALNVDLNGILAKIGVKNFKLDIYNLGDTLMPVLGADAIIPLLNAVLGLIKIGGSPLGLKLNAVDWLQLASHGTTVVAASQAATYGSRIFVQGDSSETLIAVLRYLIETINSGDNFDKISSLIGGLLGDGSNESITNMITQVLGMLQNDTDLVIADLVGLLETLA